ncbi:MAG: energy-coupling factor ABC transporter ATP-binding protein, partial [Bacilli bacterium]
DVFGVEWDKIVVMDGGEIVAVTDRAGLLQGDVLRKFGLREPVEVVVHRALGQDGVVRDARLSDDARSRLIDRLANADAPIQHEVQPLLTVEGVDFHYVSHKPILSDVSFSVARGEMVALVGKNGAGKSTLTKLICGLVTPTAGDVRWGNDSMRTWSIKQRCEQIGFVMQNPNHMISHAQVYDEVAFSLRNRGLDEATIESKVRDVLRVAGLYPFRNWPVSALSYGQKKRLTIASIVVTEPELLILDEPTAGQDFKHYSEMMRMIRHYVASGMSVLFITHDLHLMLEHTSRCVVLADGEVVYSGDTVAVFERQDVLVRSNLKVPASYSFVKQLDTAHAAAFFAWLQRESEGV